MAGRELERQRFAHARSHVLDFSDLPESAFRHCAFANRQCAIGHIRFQHDKFVRHVVISGVGHIKLDSARFYFVRVELNRVRQQRRLYGLPGIARVSRDARRSHADHGCVVDKLTGGCSFSSNVAFGERTIVACDSI